MRKFTYLTSSSPYFSSPSLASILSIPFYFLLRLFLLFIPFLSLFSFFLVLFFSFSLYFPTPPLSPSVLSSDSISFPSPSSSFFLLLSFCPYYTSFRPFLWHLCLNFPPHSFPIARLPLPILFSSIYSSTSCLPSSSLFPCSRSPSICPATPSSSSFSFSLTPYSRTILSFPSFFLLFSHSFPF